MTAALRVLLIVFILSINSWSLSLKSSNKKVLKKSNTLELNHTLHAPMDELTDNGFGKEYLDSNREAIQKLPNSSKNEGFETFGTNKVSAKDENNGTSLDNLKAGRSEETDYHHRWMIWIQVVVGGVLAMYSGVKMYYLCLKFCKDPDTDPETGPVTIICYLCSKRVPVSEWSNKESGHRRYCAVRCKDHRDLLTDMPRSDVPCKHCGELLRIWPCNIGNPFFTCKEPGCPSNGEQIRNNSANRFNCFICDFDMCRRCGDLRILTCISAIPDQMEELPSGSAAAKVKWRNGKKRSSNALKPTNYRNSFHSEASNSSATLSGGPEGGMSPFLGVAMLGHALASSPSFFLGGLPEVQNGAEDKAEAMTADKRMAATKTKMGASSSGGTVLSTGPKPSKLAVKTSCGDLIRTSSSMEQCQNVPDIPSSRRSGSG